MVNSSVAQPASGPGEGLRARDVWQLPAALVSPRTWLATIHLLAGLLVGILTFTAAMTGLSLGVGLLPLFLVGIPVLTATAWVAIGIAHFERARFSLLLGETIPPPPAPTPGGAWWQPLIQPLRTASTWRQLGYCLLWLPVGIIDFTVTVVIWAIPLALITLPTYNFALPRGGASIGGLVVHGPLELAGAVLAGLVILLAAPLVVRGLATMETALARVLLGPGTRALAARVAQLEDSRARVVGAAEAERLRIERDLHDGAQQRLVSVAMELGRAKAKFSTDPEGARDLIDRAHAEAKEALVELRQLVRRLRPRRPLPHPGRGDRRDPGTTLAHHRVHRLFRSCRVPRQRGQARPRSAGFRRHPRRGRGAEHQRARRRRRRRGPHRRRPLRARRPRRRGRRQSPH
jgi:signal transduction histidine kinase